MGVLNILIRVTLPEMLSLNLFSFLIFGEHLILGDVFLRHSELLN